MLSKKKLLEWLEIWIHISGMGNQEKQAYNQIKHAITVFYNVILPESKPMNFNEILKLYNQLPSRERILFREAIKKQLRNNKDVKHFNNSWLRLCREEAKQLKKFLAVTQNIRITEGTLDDKPTS